MAALLCAATVAQAQSGSNKVAGKPLPQTIAAHLVPVTSPVAIEIDGRTVRMPVPDGYVDRVQDAAFVRIMGAMLPPGLRLHGYFMEATDAASGDMERPDRHPSYVVASSRHLAGKDVSALGWETMRPQMRLQMERAEVQGAMQGAVQEGLKRASAAGGVSMKGDIAFKARPQLAEAADGSLRMIADIPARLTVAGQSADANNQVGMWMGAINKRLVIVYIYRAPQATDAPEHAELRRLLDALAVGLRDANP